MENKWNMMINQKNLKLKDYLRLTSLSSDAKFDRFSKSSTKKNLTKNPLKVSKIISKQTSINQNN